MYQLQTTNLRGFGKMERVNKKNKLEVKENAKNIISWKNFTISQFGNEGKYSYFTIQLQRY